MQKKQKLKVAAAGIAAVKESGSLDILKVKIAKATILPKSVLAFDKGQTKII